MFVSNFGLSPSFFFFLPLKKKILQLCDTYIMYTHVHALLLSHNLWDVLLVFLSRQKRGMSQTGFCVTFNLWPHLHPRSFSAYIYIYIY